MAHAAALRALLTESPAVLPNRVGDPLLPLQIGIWDALLAVLRPGAEPEALARVLRGYTRSTGYFMACGRKDAMRHDLEQEPWAVLAVGPACRSKTVPFSVVGVEARAMAPLIARRL